MGSESLGIGCDREPGTAQEESACYSLCSLKNCPDLFLETLGPRLSLSQSLQC